MTVGMIARRPVPAAAAIASDGEQARVTRATPTTPAPNPRTEAIQPTLPKNPPESTTPPDPEPTTPPDTTVPTTNSTFPIPTPQRPTDSCQVCDRALPGPASFISGAAGC